MERVGSVRVELEVEVWVVCDPCERKQEERYSCVYIYIYMRKRKLGRDHDVMECRRVLSYELTRGTAKRRLHTNCLVIKGDFEK